MSAQFLHIVVRKSSPEKPKRKGIHPMSAYKIFKEPGQPWRFAKPHWVTHENAPQASRRVSLREIGASVVLSPDSSQIGSLLATERYLEMSLKETMDILRETGVEANLEADGGLRWEARGDVPSFSVVRGGEPYAFAGLVGAGRFGRVIMYRGTEGGPPLALKCSFAGDSSAPIPRRHLLDAGEVAGVQLFSQRLEEGEPALGAIVSARLVMQASCRAAKPLGSRDPAAWTVAVMPLCEATLGHFEPDSLSALDAIIVCLGVLECAEALFSAGIAWVDAKSTNVLISPEGPPGGLRIMLGDHGATCKAGASKVDTVWAPTCAYPWAPVDDVSGLEPQVAWGAVVLLIELFSKRLLKGALEATHRSAMQFILYKTCKNKGFETGLPGLEGLMDTVSTCSYGDDRDTDCVRRILLNVTEKEQSFSSIRAALLSAQQYLEP